MRRLLLGVAIGVWLLLPRLHVHAQGGVASDARDAAEIVLVGTGDANAHLQRVVDELLRREGIDAVFQHAEHFMPETLLAAPDGDRRVRVFITLPTPQLARLYMRGPYGRRFLLRELTLQTGIDELGRESLAHVVATSTQALLHSTAGIDRDAARADLDRQGVASSETVAIADATPNVMPPRVVSPPMSLAVYVGLRDTVRWTGSDLGARWGAGVELGLSEQSLRWLMFRQRLSFDHSIAQSLDVPELLAYVRGSALRLGQDVALVSGLHCGVLGVSAGIDVLRITPQRARDTGWSLSPAYTEVVPMLRAELRYELSLSPVFAALSVYADVALRPVRFEVRDGTQERSVAQAASLTPALAFSLGWQSN